MVGWTDFVSHHLQSVLGAIELTVLCVAFVCIVEYFDAQMRQTPLYK